MKEELVIWGASGHALVVAEIVRLQGDYKIVGFIDDVNPERQGSEFCGSVILGGSEQLEKIAQMGIKFIICAFGNCDARLRKSAMIREKGLKLATAIHHSADISADVSLSSGTVVEAGAVIKPETVVGENVIVNSCVSIGDRCIIKDGSHIAPGVCLGTGVEVGQATWVGIGAVVREKTIIGERSIIGAGAVVLHNIPAGVIAYGVPAKVIRDVD